MARDSERKKEAISSYDELLNSIQIAPGTGSVNYFHSTIPIIDTTTDAPYFISNPGIINPTLVSEVEGYDKKKKAL